MLRLSRALAFAAASAALLARSSMAADTLLDEVMDERDNAADAFASAAEQMGMEEGSNQPETLSVRVAEIQGMNESDLKLELRALYSTSKDAQEKQIFPAGSLEAMQEVLNRLGSVDEEERDVAQYMNRYAYLVAKVLKAYNEFFSLKVTLGDPKLSREDYKKEVARLPALAAKWTEANELLVAYLTQGATDMKDKWDQDATTNKRLREVSSFIEKLTEIYEAQQRLFRAGYALTELRYMEHPDRQADLTALMADPRQKQALTDFDDALENIKEKTHQARKAASHCVEDGILPGEYLTLLPFPPDKQREEDDLPANDEM